MLAVCGVLLMLMQYAPLAQMLGGPRHQCPHCTGAYCPLKSKACKKQIGYCPHMPGMHHARPAAASMHMQHRGPTHATATPASAISCSCRNAKAGPTAVLVLDHAIVPHEGARVEQVFDRPFGHFSPGETRSLHLSGIFRPPEARA